MRNLFYRIAARRQRSSEGPLPISHSDYEAALRRFCIEPESWEHDALDAMEAAWMSAVQAEIKADFERHQKAGK